MSNKQIKKRLEQVFEGLEQEDQEVVKSTLTPHVKADITDTLTAIEEPDMTPEPEISESHHLVPTMGTRPLPPLPKELEQLGNNTDTPTMAVPFRTDSQNWAVLELNPEDQDRVWSTEEQTLVKQVTDQLSLALENARLYQQSQQLAAELQILNEMARDLTSRLDLESVIESIYIHTQQLLPADSFTLYLFATQSQVVTIPFSVVNKQRRENSIRPLGGYLADQVIRSRRPLIISDDIYSTLTSLGIKNIEQVQKENIKSWMCAPLLLGETIMGAIEVFDNEKESTYNNHHVELLVTIANQAVTAIQNANLFQQTRQRNEYLAGSAEIGRLVTSTLELDVLFSRTVNLISDRFNFYHAAIFTIDDSGTTAVLRSATGVAGQEMLDASHSLQVGSKSIVGTVTSTGIPLVVNDTATDPNHRPNPLLPDTRSEAAIPLRIGNRIIGVLDLQSKTANAFSEDDITVFQSLADQIAVAIDNARSYELAQQAIAEMRELDKLKSQFLANMSHELRTPLNSIIGFSRVILKEIDGPITELQEQDLNAIYNSGQHLLRLINDILDLSKIDAGKMELAFEDVNLSELLQSVIPTVVGLLKDKPIKLEQEISPEIPTIRADAMRIRQVMINLLSNAAKFTEQGTIKISANIEKGKNNLPEVVVRVTDTGLGITAEDQQKLFLPFSQVDSSPTRKTGGTGLGLSISSRVIELHGGKIDVESKLNVGSTFYFTLPLQKDSALAQIDAIAPGEKVILAVDDDVQIIQLYERYLQPQGYRVVHIADPTSVIEQARKLKPFAITLDIMMPGRDGWSVLAELKNNPDTRATPVIVCSILEEEEKGYNLGASSYLMKPILEDDLLRALSKINPAPVTNQ